MDKNKSQRQTGQGKQGQAQDQGNTQRKKAPIVSDLGFEGRQNQNPVSARNQNAQAQRPSSESSQDGSNQERKSDKTITNQDEQRQATNAGNSDRPMGEEEIEGDRQQEERLKPYKNDGEHSGQTDKKSPTMK